MKIKIKIKINTNRDREWLEYINIITNVTAKFTEFPEKKIGESWGI